MSFLSLSFLFTKLDLKEIVVAMQNIENKRENIVLVTTFCLPLPKLLKGNDLVTELALSTALFCLFSRCKPMHPNERKTVNQADNLFFLPLTPNSHISDWNEAAFAEQASMLIIPTIKNFFITNVLLK